MNVPKLRFKGFEGEWEDCSFTDIVKRVSSSSDSNVLPKVEFEDIVAGEGRLNKDVSNKFDSRKGILFQPYDILYGKLRPYLKNWLFPDFEGIALGDFWVFRAINTAPYFIYILIQSERYQRAANDTTGTKMPRSDWKKVSTTKFYIPKSLQEQQKIGLFFEKLDWKIQLQQEKIDLLQKQKKGFLQKMFPKAGESQPELRFDEFKGDWKQYRLGEVSEIIGGGTPNTKKAEYWNGNISWYSPTEIGENIYLHESQKKITELGLQKSSARILPIGTVLFTSRAGIGKTAILTEEGCTNQGFQSIVPNPNKLDTYFIFSRTAELKRYGEKNGAGSTFIEISGKQMSRMPILLPSIKEQRKVGLFFKRLDDRLTLEKRKLKGYQKQKQAFLQQMFI